MTHGHAYLPIAQLQNWKMLSELYGVWDWAAEQAGSSSNKCSGFARFESPPGHRLFRWWFVVSCSSSAHIQEWYLKAVTASTSFP